MRAARVHELGASPRLGDVDDPQPAEGRSAARIRAAALNPLDLAVAAGRFYGGHPPLPYIPGSEAVVELDDGTRGWFYGDGAGTTRDGTLAERTLVRDELVIPLPDGADDATAAALGIAGSAGWGALERGRVGPGDRVLVLGATGTAGSIAVQGARLLGADRIVAAGRDERRLERALELGADDTVQLDADDLVGRFKESAGDDGPTVVLDFVWNGPLVAASEAAAPHARLVNVGQSAGPEAALTSAAVRGKELDVLGYSLFARAPAERSALYLGLLSRAQAGDIRVDIETFPLAEIDEAWRRQAAGAKSVVVF